MGSGRVDNFVLQYAESSEKYPSFSYQNSKLNQGGKERKKKK